LRKDGRSSRCVRLKLRLFDFSTCTRQRAIAATQDDISLHAVVRELLREAWDGRSGIRLLGVTAAQLVDEASATQRSLFESVDTSKQKGLKVLRAMDAIRDRHGEDAVRRGAQRRDTTPWGPGV
jgi:DNA polymerase-4